MYCPRCGMLNDDRAGMCGRCKAPLRSVVPPYASVPPGAAHVPSAERTLGMCCHLLGLCGFVGPLILWLVKKEDSPFVDDQGKESLNFQISIIIYCFSSFLLAFAAIGFFLMPAVMIFNIVMIIIASIRANSGERYRYPLCIRFVR